MAETRRVLLIVGLGCLGIVVLGAVAVGTCGYAIYRATSAPADTAHEFLAALRGRNFAHAYAHTSSTYQSTHPYEAFERDVAGQPAFVSATDATLSSRQVDASGTATMGGTLETPAGPVPVSLALVREGEQWKVASITLAGTPLP